MLRKHPSQGLGKANLLLPLLIMRDNVSTERQIKGFFEDETQATSLRALLCVKSCNYMETALIKQNSPVILMLVNLNQG